MNYEMFQKGAALNAEFEVIPTKLKLLSEGVVLDEKGYMKYDGKTYVTNMVKLAELPTKLQALFRENKFGITKPSHNVEKPNDKPLTLTIDGNLSSLNKLLMEQLQNIVDPEKTEKIDMPNELKKANTVCNLADKIITIVDISLKAEILNEKRKRRLNRPYE